EAGSADLALHLFREDRPGHLVTSIALMHCNITEYIVLPVMGILFREKANVLLFLICNHRENLFHSLAGCLCSYTGIESPAALLKQDGFLQNVCGGFSLHYSIWVDLSVVD